MKLPHAIVIAVMILAGAGCSGGNGPTSTTTTVPPTSTTTSTVPATTTSTTSVPGVIGSFTVQNLPCIAPASGNVSCTFVGSASGFSGTPRFDWTFVAPLGTQTSTGPQVRPDLGCGYSVGVRTFQVAITLTITGEGKTVVVGPLNQEIGRQVSICGAV